MATGAGGDDTAYRVGEGRAAGARVRGAGMATQEDVRRIALALPAATEEAGFTFRVAGKGFVWLWRERVDPKKAKVPNPGVIVVRVADLGEKEALLASDPAVFFTTDHYDGYRAVLVRLEAIDPSALEEVITDSWRTQAPRAPRALLAETEVDVDAEADVEGG